MNGAGAIAHVAAHSVLGGILSAMLVVGPAMAQTKTIVRAGTWEAFGGSTSKGAALCGMSTETNTRYFSIKRVGGSDVMSVQLGTPQWKLTDGERKQVRLAFDSKAARSSAGVGMHFDDGDPGLEFAVPAAEIEEFLREFRAGTQLTVQFPDANFPDWKVPLSGSSAVADAFQQCAKRL